MTGRRNVFLEEIKHYSLLKNRIIIICEIILMSLSAVLIAAVFLNKIPNEKIKICMLSAVAVSGIAVCIPKITTEILLKQREKILKTTIENFITVLCWMPENKENLYNDFIKLFYEKINEDFTREKNPIRVGFYLAYYEILCKESEIDGEEINSFVYTNKAGFKELAEYTSENYIFSECKTSADILKHNITKKYKEIKKNKKSREKFKKIVPQELVIHLGVISFAASVLIAVVKFI